jgi:hypothetical protein
MTHDIPILDAAGLRRFGLLTAALTCGFFGLFLPFVFHRAMPMWPWYVAGGLAVWSVAAPASLRLFYGGWMRMGMLMGAIMNPVILAIVYFALISPLGMIMRMFGHDPMGKKREASTTTYRTISRKLSAHNMERPF